MPWWRVGAVVARTRPFQPPKSIQPIGTSTRPLRSFAPERTITAPPQQRLTEHFLFETSPGLQAGNRARKRTKSRRDDSPLLSSLRDSKKPSALKPQPEGRGFFHPPRIRCAPGRASSRRAARLLHRAQPLLQLCKTTSVRIEVEFIYRRRDQPLDGNFLTRIEPHDLETTQQVKELDALELVHPSHHLCRSVEKRSVVRPIGAL